MGWRDPCIDMIWHASRTAQTRRIQISLQYLVPVAFGPATLGPCMSFARSASANAFISFAPYLSYNFFP